MPYGIIINCAIVALGGILGSILGKYIPQRICDFLSKLFGITSITIGITLMGKINSLSAVMLALILGAIVGEGFRFEDKLKSLSVKLKSVEEHYVNKNGINRNQSTEKFISILILICTGSTGLMGAMTEAMTNDASILVAKSVLDLFASAIFASTLGISICLIAIPQFLIYISLFLLSRFITPYVTPYMVADFMACGGVIAFVTGLRIAEIKSMNLSSLLPALLFVMPISWLWMLVFS
ncbi:DUF554 domain-containing protein [Natronincola ferrireducens]|uniref:DUF554 domain-containing protein n=1 Tax=Natronincola ferrireducens TaxID=393762 RepID=A0A1G9D9Q5_9FIRM|nr:DUF554 domain-containing protein [Natronincola ferrireducens]SDK60629.1 hypothetical protein SAMN05660472_01695 [Natronincola ferrireducens]